MSTLHGTEVTAGAGLGLAIAQAVVHAHGGWIRAESPAEGGTTIRFAVPGYEGA